MASTETKAVNGGNQEEKNEPPKLKWWQLSLLGVGCTIGTGFFLGSAISIKAGGPAALLSYAIAALVTLVVFDVLAKMTAEEPLEGSFRAYAKKAFGRWAGFSSGWVYWSSELLIMGSQLTALSLFTRHWLAGVPMWIFAACYGALGLCVVVIGTKAFERVENVFAVVKIAAILMFIVIALLVVLNVIYVHGERHTFTDSVTPFAPFGFIGWWSSLLLAIYAFGGIEVMGLMAMRLQKPEEAPKAGRVMLLLLAVIYIASLLLAILLVPWQTFHSKQSPFMLALALFRLPWALTVFNAVLIVAGFSTMVASLFAVTKILVTLAKDKDAPTFFTRSWKGKPIAAISLTTGGLVLSTVFALLMPGRIYEYFTIAAGLMLLYNWLFILASSFKLLKLTVWGRVKSMAGMAVLLAAVAGCVVHHMSRPGFYISLAFAAVIGVLTLVMRKRWKGGAPSGPQQGRTERFSPKQHSERLKSKIRAKSD
ncbi:amino acid permease [Paenibacillus sp. R14(2021)]|uniref:amino acid permease n=1 Tax=Paenibacillus sp. R14(2021) TaxID=2859228 RepID=UPI001C614E43|nr:amino acid permease [Paenibacillus sp. R14(2021)]